MRRNKNQTPVPYTAGSDVAVYQPTFAQRWASKALDSARNLPATQDTRTNWEMPRYQPRYDAPVAAPVYDAEIVNDAAPLPELLTTQIRLIGEKKALDKTVIALESAGFKLASVSFRKTRDVNSDEKILNATLIISA